MKAVGYNKSLPIDQANALFDFETERPEPGEHDLLVKIQATSVNPVDTKVRMRKEAEGDTPVILGWDAVGTVVETGSTVTGYSVGDEIWYAGDLNRQGTNAEYHLVDYRIVGKKPASLAASEAAALPLTTLTAFEMLFDRLQVTNTVPGAAPAVVIIGGAGGVGSIAIQLLRALTELTVIATASRPETQSWVKELGAHHVVNHAEPLAEQISALGIGNPGYVFSTNQTDRYVEQLAELIAPQGRVGLIDDPANLTIMPFKPKSVSIHWELMYTRSLFHTPDMARQGDILNEVARLVDAGKVRTTATETLGAVNAETLNKAHAILESGKARGKLVLEGF